jgi:hypothetical protein
MSIQNLFKRIKYKIWKSSIKWYRTDSDMILGFCNKGKWRGVYRCSMDGSNSWEFCREGTKEWDRYHQKVYWQGRASPITFSEFKDKAPPLPQKLPPEAIRNVVVNLPEKEGPYSGAPDKLLHKIHACPGQRMPVHVVLMEDRYESALGDGIFRNFDSAFFDKNSAQSHIENDFEPNEFVQFQIRKLYLAAVGNGVILDTKDANISPFDHFSLRQVCDDLADRLD